MRVAGLVRLRVAWLACLLAGLLATAGEARADGRSTAAPAPDGTGAPPRAEALDKRRIVGILEVRVEGVPDEVKESFQRGLESQVDSTYAVKSRAWIKQLMTRSTRWTEGCTIGACLSEVRAQTGADLVLLAALTGAGTSFGYVVTLVRTDTGRVLYQEADRCDVCTVNEALGKATRATTQLLARVPDQLPDDTAAQTASVDLAVSRVQTQLTAQQRHTRRLGFALALVGAGLVLTGAALYAADSNDAATVTTSSGAAMTLSGIVVLTF